AHLFRAREVIAAKRSITERMRGQTRDMQREAILRQQLQAIQKELGGGDLDEVGRLRERLDERELPEEVQKAVERELRRLERINPASPERGVAVDWLEWVADLPWNTTTATGIDLNRLEQILAESHFGLED